MRHLRSFFSLTALLLAFSCTKSNADGDGYVSFDLNSNVEIADQTKSSVSQFTDLPGDGDFTVAIKDASSALVWTGNLSEWDVTRQLPAGNYKVTATYGDLEVEGFGKPYFTGEADFTITKGQTTVVPVNVALGNTVVLVRYTDSFRNYYQDYSFDLVRNNNTIVTFAKGEDRGAFVDGYMFSIKGTLTGQGKSKTFTKDYSGLEAAIAYTFLFDAGNVGGASITLTFSNTVETIYLGDIELND